MWKTFAAVLIAVPVVTQSDCGSCDGSTPDPDPVDDTGADTDTDTDVDTDTDTDTDTDVDTDTDTDTDTGVPGPCDSYIGLVDGAAIASTPMGDASTELLAIEVDGTFTADPARYTRLAADLGHIRLVYPALSGISYFPWQDGRSLLLTADAATTAAMQAGTYGDWECPNTFYEHTNTVFHASFIELGFEGIYDTSQLASVYAALPGVLSAEPNGLSGDGPTVCATAEADTLHYIFDDASGNCPSGCIDHAFTYFTSAIDGTVTYGGQWTPNDGTPPPSWLSDWGSCL